VLHMFIGSDYGLHEAARPCGIVSFTDVPLVDGWRYNHVLIFHTNFIVCYTENIRTTYSLEICGLLVAVSCLRKRSIQKRRRCCRCKVVVVVVICCVNVFTRPLPSIWSLLLCDWPAPDLTWAVPTSVKLSTHLNLLPILVWEFWSYPSTPAYTFRVLCLIKRREQLSYKRLKWAYL
jgi:hypothetical protein